MTVQQAYTCLNQLKRLKKAKTRKELKKILENSPKCIIRVIKEIAKETLKGNIKISKYQKKKLIPYKNKIRSLVKLPSANIKRTILNQRGGFLSSLLVPAITLLANLSR